MKEIKTITLEFENVDDMTFEPKDFVYFSIDDIWTEIRTCGYGIDKFVHADTVEMQIKWEANDWHEPFEYSNSKHDEFKFDRIQDYDDITHIAVVYDDGTTERYVVNWEDASEYGEENKKQISVTINDGLLIRIANDVWWDTKDSGKKWRYEQTDKEKEADKNVQEFVEKFERHFTRKNKDVAEVVTCKDCRFASTEECKFFDDDDKNTATVKCLKHNIYVDRDDYCSQGEEKHE